MVKDSYVNTTDTLLAYGCRQCAIRSLDLEQNTAVVLIHAAVDV